MNKAEYIQHMGDDLTVVNAARVSFDKVSEYELALEGEMVIEERLSEADTKLIGYLSRNGHWTPFSHPMISIRETVPIFVARQRFKHMVGFTYNEVSRRYVDDEPDFFVPEEWRSRPAASIKQGSGASTVCHLNDTRSTKSAYADHLAQSEKLYTSMLNSGVAPEMARMVLPQSMVTSYWVTGSLHAWARAYKQRIDGHAQKEIQDLAVQWNEIIQPLFPVSWKALTA